MLANRFVVDWEKDSQGDKKLKYFFQKQKFCTKNLKYLATNDIKYTVPLFRYFANFGWLTFGIRDTSL